MEDLFERLTQLLGESPTGMVFSSFVANLGQEFFTEDIGHGDTVTYIPGSGLTMITVDRVFQSILFEFDASSLQAKNWCKYSGNLVNGITAGDTRADVRSKLSVNPINSDIISTTARGPKSHMDTYEMPPLILNLIFEAETETISSVGITKVLS